MPSKILKVINPKGMHARAASKIVSITSSYKCSVTLSHKNASAPGDSLLKLLTLNAPIGSEITIDAEGLGANKVLEELENLFEDGFGE
jgi:phosphotransferase system HPr (HPr) family protein